MQDIRLQLGENFRGDSRYQNKRKVKNNDIAVVASFVICQCLKIEYVLPESRQPAWADVTRVT